MERFQSEAGLLNMPLPKKTLGRKVWLKMTRTVMILPKIKVTRMEMILLMIKMTRTVMILLMMKTKKTRSIFTWSMPSALIEKVGVAGSPLLPDLGKSENKTGMSLCHCDLTFT